MPMGKLASPSSTAGNAELAQKLWDFLDAEVGPVTITFHLPSLPCSSSKDTPRSRKILLKKEIVVFIAKRYRN